MNCVKSLNDQDMSSELKETFLVVILSSLKISIRPKYSLLYLFWIRVFGFVLACVHSLLSEFPGLAAAMGANKQTRLCEILLDYIVKPRLLTKKLNDRVEVKLR